MLIHESETEFNKASRKGSYHCFVRKKRNLGVSKFATKHTSASSVMLEYVTKFPGI